MQSADSTACVLVMLGREMTVSVASELNDSVGDENCNERPTGILLDASSP
jgi:hypothetical protein